MELHAHDIASLDGGGEGVAVFCNRYSSLLTGAR